MDLLLHLIRKNEVDIYDIPIALITGQYLKYLNMMESLNIEVAGEFLLMAATLTQIKSKLLVPTLMDEEEVEDEDPRMAIVRPLLEHMKMRDAAEALERRELLDRDVFAREVSLEEIGLEPEEPDLVEANLFDLIDAFRRIVSEFDAKAGLEIIVETKTIQERITEIMRKLKADKQTTFENLCTQDRNKAELILSFLAVLELARIGYIRLYQHQITGALTLFHQEEASVYGYTETDPDENGLASEDVYYEESE